MTEPANQEPVTSNRKPVLGNAVRIVVSVGLLALLLFLFRNRLPQALADIKKTQALPLALAAGWYVLFIFVSAWRWQVLLAARELRFSTWYLARVFTLGLFFCKLLPTSIGGDVMRIAYTARPGKGVEAFSATFLDRLIGFVSLTFLAVATALGLFAARGLWGQRLALRQDASGVVTLAARGDVMFLVLVAILAALVVLTLALFNDRLHRLFAGTLGRVKLFGLGRLLDRAYDAVKQFRNHSGALAASFGLGIGVQAALSFAWFYAARALGADVPLVYYLIFIPLLNIVVNVPSIGGLGVREASFVALFTQVWVPGAMGLLALSVAILFLALDLVFALTGGVMFAFMRRPAAPIQNPKSKILSPESQVLSSLTPDSNHRDTESDELSGPIENRKSKVGNPKEE